MSDIKKISRKKNYYSNLAGIYFVYIKRICKRLCNKRKFIFFTCLLAIAYIVFLHKIEDLECEWLRNICYSIVAAGIFDFVCVFLPEARQRIHETELLVNIYLKKLIELNASICCGLARGEQLDFKKNLNAFLEDFQNSYFDSKKAIPRKDFEKLIGKITMAKELTNDLIHNYNEYFDYKFIDQFFHYRQILDDIKSFDCQKNGSTSILRLSNEHIISDITVMYLVNELLNEKLNLLKKIAL